jgi:hypothetical protein
MLFEVGLKLIPVPAIIPDFLAVAANRKHAAQGFHFCQQLLKGGLRGLLPGPGAV